MRFRHPLVRSAAYQSASLQERQSAHRALAEVTDAKVDPDRRAWHLAQATPGPDEDVAEELERSADRAQRRGGLAAAAAFLERAATLTPEPGRRAQRLLAAATAKHDAGTLDAALGLLVAVEAGPPDDLRTAEVEHLRGQIALEQRRGGDAGRLLVSAARRLEPLNAALARETHLEALGAAMAFDLEIPGGVLEAAKAARAAPAGPEPPRAVDVMLDGFAIRVTDGYAAAAPTLTRALDLMLALDLTDDESRRSLWLAGGRPSIIVPIELWDAEAFHVLAARQVQLARDAGALVHLQLALSFLARSHVVAGELTTASLLLDEDRLIAEATGNPAAGECRDAARGLARPGDTGVGADRGHRRGGRRTRVGTSNSLRELGALQRPGSPRRGARCRAATYSTGTRWGTGPGSSRSWPRQHPEPATRRS